MPRFSALLFGISPIQRCDFLCLMFDHFFWTLRILKSKNKQGIPHVLAWLKIIIKKTIKHQNNPYSVIPTHDHQTLNVSSNFHKATQTQKPRKFVCNVVTSSLFEPPSHSMRKLGVCF
jgi:hypothetical protein